MWSWPVCCVCVVVCKQASVVRPRAVRSARAAAMASGLSNSDFRQLLASKQKQKADGGDGGAGGGDAAGASATATAAAAAPAKKKRK